VNNRNCAGAGIISWNVVMIMITKMVRIKSKMIFISGLCALFITQYVMLNWMMTIRRTNNRNVRAAVAFIVSRAAAAAAVAAVAGDDCLF